MKTSDIPAQVLNEVFKTIAQMHDTDPSKLVKDQVSEDEFMAALAYNQGSPLIDTDDLTEELIAMCRVCSRELDPAGMAEYRFVPMTSRGQTLLVVSSCPWDPMMVEVISGYFPQCSQVRFALASPQTLGELLGKLKNEPMSAVAGYSAAKLVAPPRAIQPPVQPPTTVPQPPKPIAPPVTGPTPSVPNQPSLPQTARIAPPTAPKPAATVPPAAPVTTSVDPGMLTPDEVAYLLTLVVQEGNKMLLRKRNQR